MAVAKDHAAKRKTIYRETVVKVLVKLDCQPAGFSDALAEVWRLPNGEVVDVPWGAPVVNKGKAVLSQALCRRLFFDIEQLCPSIRLAIREVSNLPIEGASKVKAKSSVRKGITWG